MADCSCDRPCSEHPECDPAKDARRLAQRQQPANQVDPDAGGVPKENPVPAAVPVEGVVVELTAAERQRIMDGSATVSDVDRLYRQVGRKLRVALSESEGDDQ